MNPTIRNIFAVIIGLFLGSVVNMGIILIGGSIITPPEGADVTTMEGLTKSMELFQPRHFLMPFLAHALGTFVGAYFAGLIATKNKLTFAISIGVLFLIGGIINVLMLPSPMWFNAVDILFAYIPMAWMAGLLSRRK